MLWLFIVVEYLLLYVTLPHFELLILPAAKYTQRWWSLARFLCLTIDLIWMISVHRGRYLYLPFSPLPCWLLCILTCFALLVLVIGVSVCFSLFVLIDFNPDLYLLKTCNIDLYVHNSSETSLIFPYIYLFACLNIPYFSLIIMLLKN